MKKIFLAIVLIACVLTGCNRHCGQYYRSSEIPALKTDDYNSCKAVCMNYSYRVCGGESDYEYMSHAGDTIMVCGYISENWDGDRCLIPLCDYPNNSNEHRFIVHVNLYRYPIELLPEEIDISKKCYVTGVLGFEELYTNGGPYDVIPVIYDVQEVFFY